MICLSPVAEYPWRLNSSELDSTIRSRVVGGVVGSMTV
jgi:hypothetical protein